MNNGNISRLRNNVLVGAIVAALALGTAGSAMADPVTPAYTLSGGSQSLSLQGYLQALANQQLLTGDITADILGSEAGYRGPAAGGSLTVSGNLFQAMTLDAGTNLLGANGANSTVDLGLLGTQDSTLPPGNLNQGIGVVSGQLADAVAVKTSIDNAGIGLDISDYTAGNAIVTGNTMSSTTAVNNAGNSVSGALATAPFASDTSGSASVNYAPAGATEGLSGGVVIGNAQTASGVDASAQVSDSDISLVNAMSVDADSDAPVTITGNAATATATGNRGSSRFAAASGGATSYTGSVALANGQANLGGSTAAKVDGTDIGAQLQDVDGTSDYSGALDVSDNRLTAAAQGNDAAAVDASGNLVRGNSISFAQGIDVTGAGSDSGLSLSFDNNIANGAAGGDLALVNSQGNQLNAISASVGDSRIGTELVTLDGGSLTLNDNQASASVGGNSAINLVSGDSSNFDASVAAGNQQTNDHTLLSASAHDIELGAIMHGDDNDNEGNVAVTGNGVGASASGNSAQTQIDLQGSHFTAGSGDAVDAGVSSAGFTSLDVGAAGIVAGNLQANYGAGTGITAAVDDAYVELASTYDDFDGLNASVDDNTISASAAGNHARTSVAAGGAEGALTAALASGQYNANDITASMDDSDTDIYSDDDIFDSQLSLSRNVHSVSASANQATNSLSTAFDGRLALATDLGGSGIDLGASTNGAEAALVLLNNQINDGADVDATAGYSWIYVDSEDEMGDSSVDLTANAIGASAIGNSVGNSLTPAAGNLVRNNEGTLAALGNLQIMSGDSTADLTNVGIQIYSDYDAYDLAGTLSGNQISAFAGGNLAGGAAGAAGNSLLVSGTNLIDAGGADTVSYVDPGTYQGAEAAFTLQNAQSSTSGFRNAEIEEAYIEDLLDEVEHSVLSVGNNGISAEARDNLAANTLSLSGFGNLSTTAALVSTQASAGDMTGSIDDAFIGASGYEVWDSHVAISGNTLSARAVANAASNQLTVDAAQLGGAAGDGELPAAAPAGYRGAVLDDTGSSVIVADYGLNNLQQRDGDIQAGITDADIGVGAEYIDGGSSASVTGNAMNVLGQGNSASNTLSLSGSGIDASAAIFNGQDIESNVDALAGGVSIGITADDMDSAMPLTVTGNSVGVSAGMNNAVNALSADADNAVAGKVGLAGASDDSDNYDGFTGAVADFAVANVQAGNGTASATLEDAQVGIRADDAIGSWDGQSSLTVSGNQAAAQASGNVASNSVALNGGGSVSATAALHNQQVLSDGAIDATATGVDVAAGNEGDDHIRRANLTVADNVVSGAASGNSASNAINVGSAVLNGPAVGTQSQGNTTLSTVTSAAIASYALNSDQGNAATVRSAVDTVNIGVNIDGSSRAVRGGVASVGNNAVLASASGNVASNSIMLASVAGGAASAALTSSQVNVAPVSASIANAHIGMQAGPGSNSPATVTGNVISASAVGNSAVNHIGIGH